MLSQDDSAAASSSQEGTLVADLDVECFVDRALKRRRQTSELEDTLRYHDHNLRSMRQASQTTAFDFLSTFSKQLHQGLVMTTCMSGAGTAEAVGWDIYDRSGNVLGPLHGGFVAYAA